MTRTAPAVRSGEPDRLAAGPLAGSGSRPPAGLSTAGILRLQRACGNAAVGRLVQPRAVASTPSVQRWKHFKSSKEVDEFLESNPVDRKKHLTATKYVTYLKTLLPKGKNKPDEEDLRVLTEKAEAKFGGSSAVTRKALDATTWRHIWKGDLGSKGGPTGFHWKGKAGEAICESDGDVTNTAGDFYHQGVRFKAPKPKGATKDVKDEGSTFFPDDWAEQDVKDAIETRNSSDQITTAKGFGTQLTKSGGTIYPTI